MKQLLLVALLFSFGNIQAQLLKKIKEKTQQVLEPGKSNESQSSQGNETNTSAGKTKPKWTPSPEDQKLFTLENGETFLYDETKITAVNGKLSYAFIVQNKNYQYFFIEDGKRSGPFREAPVQQLQIKVEKKYDDGGDDGDDKIEIGSGNRDPVAIQYSKTINNKLYIVFNGKNFGPYDFVAKMLVSPDKKRFWAAVVIGGMSDMMAKSGIGNNFIVNEAGVKQTAGDQTSMPARFIISNNFNAAALTVMESAAQKIVTVSSSGKIQEGSMNEMYSGSKSGTIVAENGDIVSVPSQSPTQLLVNGNEAAVFKVPVKNMNRLFIMPDYKKSVYYQGGKLYRGDGSEESLTGVTFPRFVKMGNEHAIYYYKIHETEAGGKDVYLCKKIL